MGEHQLEIVNFHASFTHGCEKTCSSPRVQYAARAQISNATDVKIRSFLSCLAKARGITIKFNIVSDCPHHRIEHHDSNDDERLLKGPADSVIKAGVAKHLFFKKNFNFFSFLSVIASPSQMTGLVSRIESGLLEGFVVVKDLELCHTSCNPHMGFAIQRDRDTNFIFNKKNQS